MDIIRDTKKGLYGFMWRIILEEGLYQLQRYSKEYSCWISVRSLLESEPLIRQYNELES